MILDTVVKLAPESVEWKSPLSVETQTSPEIFGFTTTLTGDVDEPRAQSNQWNPTQASASPLPFSLLQIDMPPRERKHVTRAEQSHSP